MEFNILHSASCENSNYPPQSLQYGQCDCNCDCACAISVSSSMTEISDFALWQRTSISFSKYLSPEYKLIL